MKGIKKDQVGNKKAGTKTRVRLIHWRPVEAEGGIQALREAGYEIDDGPVEAQSLKDLRLRPPAAVVIDLSRLPAQGRDAAVALRKSKATRPVPLVFVEGAPEKVAAIRKLLPDAVFTTWKRIGADLPKIIANPPAVTFVPDSVFSAYQGVPLAKKLGIKAGYTIALIGAPEGFEKTLGGLPEGVRFRHSLRGKSDLVMWFVRSRKQLERKIHQLGRKTDHGPLWIVWPKKASGVVSDLTQVVVRRTGLASGLVDYKICSVDETWSGLAFARRKRK